MDARGTPMANVRLAQILADAGHTVHVITYPFGSALRYPGINIHRCRRVPFVRSVRIGLSAAKLLLDISLASCALRLVRSTTLHCIQGVEEGVFIAAVLSRFAKIPLVYDMDSVMSYEIGNTVFGKFPPAIWLTRAAERWAIRNAALVVTISESMAAYVKQVDQSKDVVIVPDAPMPRARGDADPDRARAQLPRGFVENRKIISYTGSLASYQGLDLLVSAMARVIAVMAEAALVIVGGTEKDIKRLASKAEGVGVMHHVLLVGKKPPDQIPDFLSMADVLVSPRRGGINPPAKIYTYMHAGKPIVATDIPAHTTVLGRDAAILVEPTADGVADGILWALTHPDEAARKASHAEEIVSRITPELQVRRLLEGYELVKQRIGIGGKQERRNAGRE